MLYPHVLADGRSFSGVIKSGVLTLDDGHVWTKMIANTDFHLLPKEAETDFKASPHMCPCCHSHVTKAFQAER